MACTIQGIQQLFDTISETSGLPAFSFDDTGACRIDTASGLSVHYQIREPLGDIVMLTPLGSVPDDVRSDIFRLMLSANFYWQDTVGATLCWNSRLDEAVLEIALPAADLTAEKLLAAVANFAELADIWKERLSTLSDEAEARLLSDPDDDDGDSFSKTSPSEDGFFAPSEPKEFRLYI